MVEGGFTRVSISKSLSKSLSHVKTINWQAVSKFAYEVCKFSLSFQGRADATVRLSCGVVTCHGHWATLAWRSLPACVFRHSAATVLNGTHEKN